MRSKRVELILDTLKAVRGAKDLSKETDRVADALGKTAREGDKAGRAVDKAGKEMSDAARAAAKLDREIDQLTGSLKELAVVQALTGDTMSKQIKQAEDKLRSVSKNRKLLGDASEPAAGFVANLSAKMGPLLAKLPISGPMGAGLAAAAASAAPLLGAAVAGGIIGGVGIGGVIGGITLAAKDVRVKAAADNLGDRLEKRLLKAGGTFVEPVLDGLQDIQRAADDIDLEKIFADSSRFVQPLAGGVASAVTDIGHALTELVGVAGPPIAAISNGIAQIGKSAAGGLSSLKDNADGAADALRTVFGIISFGVTTTFQAVNALTELYELNKAMGGDVGLQLTLKAVGAQMDNNTFSARRTADGMGGLSDASIRAAVSTEELKKQQQELKVVQDAAKAAQDALGASLDSLGGKTTFAARSAEALRTAMDNLYGASIRQTDANEGYEASWDSLSDSVKTNKNTLDVHTAAGRANRDVLQGLLSSNNDLYLANINAGESEDTARKKHQDRTEAVRKESVRLGLNKAETEKLIGTYGRIPGKKTTDLVLDGVREVVQALTRLYIYQRALAEGRSTASIEQKLRTGSDSGPAKRGGGFRSGGRTGDIPEDQVAGVVHGKELVLNAPTVRRIDRQNPGFLDELHATGQLPGYRTGGRVAPVDTSHRWPFAADMSGTYVMSRAQAASKVTPAFGGGGWPSSPSAVRGDSGRWRKIKAFLDAANMGGSFGNGYRPGDPKWHGSGWAVDWMGYNLDRLATRLAGMKPLELIHRTRNRDYAYTRGQNRGSFSSGLMEAHRNHIHIAMLNGGVIPEPVLGVGKSGRTYSFAENGRPERVLSAGQTAAGGGTVTIAPVIHINGSTLSARQIAAEVSREIGKQADAYARSVA